jgi:hypothetical protein
MFFGRVNDTSKVVRMTAVGDATARSITYNCDSDESRSVIYDPIIFIIQAWTNFSLQDEPWAEFSTLEVAA